MTTGLHAEIEILRDAVALDDEERGELALQQIALRKDASTGDELVEANLHLPPTWTVSAWGDATAKP